MTVKKIVQFDGALLLFGGPYGNLQATRAVLDMADEFGIPAERVVCTGDLVAYCGDPNPTIRLVRERGIHVVMGNCDEQLGQWAEDCGCGFDSGSACDRLSAAWYAFASREVGDDDRQWLASLPKSIEIQIGRVRLLVVHGSLSNISEFVFAGTPRLRKAADLASIGCDGIIGGHSGLPFTDIIDGKLWHNPGVVGMPANDGTSRVWYSVLTPLAGGRIRIAHRALQYDYSGAQGAMRRAGLGPEYHDALASGLWPSLDVLPPPEREATGQRLEERVIEWAPLNTRGAGDRVSWIDGPNGDIVRTG